MKRGAVVGIVVAVVLVGGVGAAVAISATGGAGEAAPSMSRTADPMPTETAAAAETEAPAPDDTETATEPEPAPATPGAYVDYSDAALAAAEGTSVLFFHAPWCPQCRALEEDILAAGVPDGVTILKVDYDSRQDLRQQYGVTLQTTMVVVDDDGEKTALHVAYDEPTVGAVAAALGL
jgi:thiol-disulfide isomerase/thioredoxin